MTRSKKKAYSAVKHTVIVHTVIVHSSKLKFLCTYFQENTSTAELNELGIVDIVREAQPLIQPTSTIISYGAKDNKATQ